MASASDIIKLARTQIGVKENPKGSNKVIYNTEYYGREVSGSPYPWCCAFLWWLFNTAGVPELFYGGKKTASCTTLMNYYKGVGQFSTVPKIGALAFYNWGKGSIAYHIGIVTATTSTGIKAIEGNTAIGNDSNGGEVMERTRTFDQIIGFAYPYPDENEKSDKMKYSVVNNIRIAEVPVKDFRIVLYDGAKKSMGKNRCNGGFFGTYHENGEAFTLPTGHLVCDYEATGEWTKHYCTERGDFNGDKFTFDSGDWTYMNELYGKAQTTLIVQDGRATMLDLAHAPIGVDYAISGVPIMRGGEDVIFKTYVTGQGWGSGSLYGTWHVFVGIKEERADTIYVMGMKTTSGNMITSAEAYKKFKTLGFYDVIKLDGGGSFYFNGNGEVTQTAENRRVCTVIDFGGTKAETPVDNNATVTLPVLKKGSKGDSVRALQILLNGKGYNSGTVDGDFGTKTDTALKAYQKKNGLVADGIAGAKTWTALLCTKGV